MVIRIVSILPGLVASILIATVGNVDAVTVGDSRAAVTQELGEPEGRMKFGAMEVLTYERGEVELEDGVVIREGIISAEEAETRRIRREAEEAERRERLIAEGTALKEQRLADPGFHTSTATHRVAFWESFRKKYPDVPVDKVSYDAARKEFELEQAAEKAKVQEARRIADMERKLQEAEARAREAEQEASQSRKTIYTHGGFVYPTRYVPHHTYQSSTSRHRERRGLTTYKQSTHTEHNSSSVGIHR